MLGLGSFQILLVSSLVGHGGTARLGVGRVRRRCILGVSHDELLCVRFLVESKQQRADGRGPEVIRRRDLKWQEFASESIGQTTQLSKSPWEEEPSGR